jgi:hypothetical protein
MEQTLLNAVHDVLALLALPTIGLPAIFLISLISATLLPLGSEPAVFGYVKLAPDMFWPAVIVATVGNTVGGIISYFMGRGAARAVERWRDKHAASAGADGLAASGPGAGRSGPPASAAAVIEATRSDPQALPSSGPLVHARPVAPLRRPVAKPPGAPGIVIILATCGWRSVMRRGGLVASVVLALRRLYGDR